MPLPTHPLLRPGVRATRRGDGFLQVGLELPRTVVAPDSPTIRAAIARLEAGLVPELGDVATARLCRELVERELVVDGDLLLRDLGQAPVHAAYGPGAGAVLTRRAAHGIEVLGPPDVAERARAMVPSLPGTPTVVALLISVGVQPREAVDELLGAGRAHLLLTAVEGRVELGPFVAPGLTACLRCVDAHRGELDPRRSLVLQQYAAAGPRADGVPEPVDDLVFTAALAWAARDCLTYVDGFEPATWSRTFTFGPGMTHRAQEWSRHPHCGCSWSDLPSEVRAG